MHIKALGRHWQLPLLALRIVKFAVVVMGAIAAQRATTNMDFRSELGVALVYGACVGITTLGMGLFSRHLREGLAGVGLRLLVSIPLGALLAALVLTLIPGWQLGLRTAMVACAIAWPSLLVLWLIHHQISDDDALKRRVLVVGAGQKAGQIARLRRRSDRRGFMITGYLSAPGETVDVPQELVVGTVEELRAASDRLKINEIVVAMDDRRKNLPLRALLDCRLAGVEITELVDFLEREAGKVFLNILNPGWMIFSAGFRRDRVRRFSKRSFDLVASGLAVLLSSPIMLLAALAIKLEDGFSAPVFYSQERVGMGARVFKVRKFRSMRVDAERDGRAQWATANDSRVTRVGSVMRKTRIDELPQILNVLRGDMSFVGPRPERPQFVSSLAETIPYYEQRHTVQPGITGWAQLCYPYGSSVNDAIEKLQYDLYYVKNHTLLFDLVILLRTLEVVVMTKGAR